MKMLQFLSVLSIASIPLLAADGSDDVKNIVITANDTLRFNVTRIEVHPGEKIHLVLRNAGSLPKDVMGHNWVLLKEGKDTNAYAAAAVAAKGENFQPHNLADEVLATVPLVGRGESAEVTFNAPSTPGTYAFLCSYPAHCAAGMHGNLVVK